MAPFLVLARTHDDGYRQSDQNGDDADHHEQFDERKARGDKSHWDGSCTGIPDFGQRVGSATAARAGSATDGGGGPVSVGGGERVHIATVSTVKLSAEK